MQKHAKRDCCAARQQCALAAKTASQKVPALTCFQQLLNLTYQRLLNLMLAVGFLALEGSQSSRHQLTLKHCPRTCMLTGFIVFATDLLNRSTLLKNASFPEQGLAWTAPFTALALLVPHCCCCCCCNVKLARLKAHFHHMVISRCCCMEKSGFVSYNLKRYREDEHGPGAEVTRINREMVPKMLKLVYLTQ